MIDPFRSVAFVSGAGFGVAGVNLLSSIAEKAISADNAWSNWPRFVTTGVATLGGALIMSRQREGGRYEFGEGVFAAGVVQMLQQLWGRYVA
jgi:hypothetical protein